MLIIYKAVDPGNLKTDLYKHMPFWQRAIANLVLADPIYGAYSELFAGLSDTIVKNNGAFSEFVPAHGPSYRI